MPKPNPGTLALALTRLAQPVGLHFFEPRYRKLIAFAMQTDRRFVWASGRLGAGQRVYLCEAHNVRTYSDGRADLHVLPVLECTVRRAWKRTLTLTLALTLTPTLTPALTLTLTRCGARGSRGWVRVFPSCSGLRCGYSRWLRLGLGFALALTRTRTRTLTLTLTPSPYP